MIVHTLHTGYGKNYSSQRTVGKDRVHREYIDILYVGVLSLSTF